MSGKKEISLLPNEANNNSFSARAIRYLTTIGRYIIVFTELIVISAFISRFWLDRQNSDLSETIRQQKAIIDSTREFDKEFESLQSRLKFIDEHYKSQPSYVKNIKTIVSSLPLDVYFENFSIDANSAQISLYSFQENSLIDMIVNLTLNPSISKVNVKSIQKKARDTKFYVNLELMFKPNNAKSAV